MRVMRIRSWLFVLALTAVVAGSCGEEAAPVSVSTPRGASVLSSSPTALPDGDPEVYAAVLREARGKPLVVNVWASWCGPCRLEGPALAEAATRYGDGVSFLGIDVLDAKPDARAFIDEFGWSYPSLFDATGAIRDNLGIVGQPATIFYDAEGGIVDTHVGSITAEQLTAQVEALLGE